MPAAREERDSTADSRQAVHARFTRQVLLEMWTLGPMLLVRSQQDSWSILILKMLKQASV